MIAAAPIDHVGRHVMVGGQHVDIADDGLEPVVHGCA
jgi:hypothetical protein